MIVEHACAQSGASGNKGTYLNYEDYVNTTRVSGGDFDIDVSGVLQIGKNGEFDIVGSLNNKGTIILDSGAILNVFGDVINSGVVSIKKGAVLRFKGQLWKNTATAQVIDGAGVNSAPGGELIIDVNRPAVPSAWVLASPYLLDYSDENVRQYIDGGNVPMDVVLLLDNHKGIELINTPTKIEGALRWSGVSSRLFLGNSDLIFTRNAAQSGYSPNNYYVTNGNGHVVKENYTGRWIFPIGKDSADYTPAMIENIIPNTMHVLVQDYAKSASLENTALSDWDGMDRTWNIYADVPVGVSSITLQHNKTSNAAAFSEDFNFVTRWSNTTPNISGDRVSSSAWQFNNSTASVPGTLSSFGLVPGSSSNARTFNDFATNPNDSIAFYTKSTRAFNLPSVEMLSFKADSIACETSVAFNVGKEANVSRYQLQHSIDGSTFTTIATFVPKGDNSAYSFQHTTAISGRNFYRLVYIESSGDYRISDVISTVVNCPKDADPVVLYPNPATDNINITGLNGQSEIRVINLHGRVMSAISTSATFVTIDVRELPAATYIAQIIDAREKITNIKFVKF